MKPLFATRLRKAAGILLAVFLLAPLRAAAAEADEVTIVSATGEHVFVVEIADDPQERARGLMHRRHLPRDAGMLFVYDTPQEASFWMKNTPLPLDILYADERGVIISIARMTTPYSTKNIPSNGAVRGVLEINGGLADELGVVEGDRLLHPIFQQGG